MNPLIETLNIPETLDPFCGLVLGYPAKEDVFKEVERKIIVHNNTYNA
jgi:hypothetical protein